jgi:hypothetical protein
MAAVSSSIPACTICKREICENQAKGVVPSCKKDFFGNFHVFHKQCVAHRTVCPVCCPIQQAPLQVQATSFAVAAASRAPLGSQGVSAARPFSTPFLEMPPKISICDVTYHYNKNSGVVYAEPNRGESYNVEVIPCDDGVKLVDRKKDATYLICKYKGFYLFYYIDKKTGLPEVVSNNGDAPGLLEKNNNRYKYGGAVERDSYFIVINTETGNPFENQVLLANGQLAASDFDLAKQCFFYLQKGVKIEPDLSSSSQGAPSSR